MIFTLNNLSNVAITLRDLNNVVVDPEASIDANQFDTAIKSSLSLKAALLAGSLSLTYDESTLSHKDACVFLDSLYTQVTRDGKVISTASDRPLGFYRCFTGCGDDLALNKIGQGPDMVMTIAEGEQDAQVDCRFVDNVYLRDGAVLYQNAPFDTHLSCDVICPAGVPFPSPTHTGSLDLVDNQFVPNASGTGAFMVAPVEVPLFKFINKLHLMGSRQTEVTSPEPFLLNFPYFLRFTLRTPEVAPAEVSVGVNLGLYRKKTQ